VVRCRVSPKTLLVKGKKGSKHVDTQEKNNIAGFALGVTARYSAEPVVHVEELDKFQIKF
jgi:hypothetical protein